MKQRWKKIEEGHMCLLDFGLSAVGGRNWGPGDLGTRAESLEPGRIGNIFKSKSNFLVAHFRVEIFWSLDSGLYSIGHMWAGASQCGQQLAKGVQTK
jgi:hypothetical protein